MGAISKIFSVSFPYLFCDADWRACRVAGVLRARQMRALKVVGISGAEDEALRRAHKFMKICDESL